jgi:hypothetical protein
VGLKNNTIASCHWKYTGNNTADAHRSDEDGLRADAVHVDARSALEIVKVDVAKLGDHVHHVVLPVSTCANSGRREQIGKGREYTLGLICMATGKSEAASAGKKMSTVTVRNKD